MTDSEKFDYIMKRGLQTITKHGLKPISLEEKEAFFYEMLLLKMPMGLIAPAVKSGYKLVLLPWLTTLKPISERSEEEKTICHGIRLL